MYGGCFSGSVEHFTQAVQKSTEATLCFLPSLVDDLVTALAPQSVTENWKNSSASTKKLIEILQEQLVSSRFEWVFAGTSLALAAAMFYPTDKTSCIFANFPISDAVKSTVRSNIIDDIQVLKPTMTAKKRSNLCILYFN